ncbi:hypothetical protein A500_19259 [Clostridium sartagoforme AAU1]|uniref:Uncharacterized protein n=1 Tax=Clostridium sartagoforme AAU1 TaxID=1202534 RepID=R9BSJ8_9CLOT|nr:hypothetical protein [Clostridium sartagoforme]EOR19982.1 hypothetical protein A500_19259 [Clostridium sartagoforme AAU1]
MRIELIESKIINCVNQKFNEVKAQYEDELQELELEKDNLREERISVVGSLLTKGIEEGHLIKNENETTIEAVDEQGREYLEEYSEVEDYYRKEISALRYGYKTLNPDNIYVDWDADGNSIRNQVDFIDTIMKVNNKSNQDIRQEIIVEMVNDKEVLNNFNLDEIQSIVEIYVKLISEEKISEYENFIESYN